MSNILKVPVGIYQQVTLSDGSVVRLEPGSYLSLDAKTAAKEWYTLQEVADILGCSVKLVDTLTQRGELPVLDINKGGGRPVLRVSKGALARFVKDRL